MHIKTTVCQHKSRAICQHSRPFGLPPTLSNLDLARSGSVKGYLERVSASTPAANIPSRRLDDEKLRRMIIMINDMAPHMLYCRGSEGRREWDSARVPPTELIWKSEVDQQLIPIPAGGFPDDGNMLVKIQGMTKRPEFNGAIGRIRPQPRGKSGKYAIVLEEPDKYNQSGSPMMIRAEHLDRCVATRRPNKESSLTWLCCLDIGSWTEGALQRHLSRCAKF